MPSYAKSDESRTRVQRLMSLARRVRERMKHEQEEAKAKSKPST